MRNRWLLAAAIAGIFVGQQLWRMTSRHRIWNENLISFASGIKPGSSKTEVLRQAKKLEGLAPGSCLLELSEDAYLFKNPPQWGAQNLNVYFEFQRARLIHRRVRNADSESLKPANTPADF